MVNHMFDVSGKIALVTGASSGFGAHFAKILSAHGAKVVVAARRTDRLEILVSEINATGGDAMAIAMDVTNSKSIRDAFDAAETKYGHVNILSNNAGVADSKMAVEGSGTKGCIVNTASILGLRAAISQASYATSKAGVVQLTKVLALEWARKNIRVNALCPGYFVTDLNREYFSSDKGKNYIAATPARRTGELDELSAPFMLLASDAGSYVNGVALPVDGAHSIGNM